MLRSWYASDLFDPTTARATSTTTRDRRSPTSTGRSSRLGVGFPHGRRAGQAGSAGRRRRLRRDRPHRRPRRHACQAGRAEGDGPPDVLPLVQRLHAARLSARRAAPAERDVHRLARRAGQRREPYTEGLRRRGTHADRLLGHARGARQRVGVRVGGAVGRFARELRSRRRRLALRDQHPRARWPALGAHARCGRVGRRRAPRRARVRRRAAAAVDRPGRPAAHRLRRRLQHAAP
eukprot:6374393-Prymnesium_polylepis.1